MERRIVRAWIAEKWRPAVILEVQPDLVRIAYGTSEPREWRAVIVNPNTRQGRLFDLPETTYFYAANVSWESPAALELCEPVCSWELFFAIRKLVEEHDAILIDERDA